METPYPAVYSVCGYHPLTGDLAYANYAGFLSRESAIAWRTSDAAKSLPLWSLQEIAEHRATAEAVNGLAMKEGKESMADPPKAPGDPGFNWLKDTTQAYRRGFVEGEEGHEDVFLLHAGLTSPADIAEYERGFYAGLASMEDPEDPEDPS